MAKVLSLLFFFTLWELQLLLQLLLLLFWANTGRAGADLQGFNLETRLSKLGEAKFGGVSTNSATWELPSRSTLLFLATGKAPGCSTLDLLG